jgi:hypothetical protein
MAQSSRNIITEVMNNNDSSQSEGMFTALWLDRSMVSKEPTVFRFTTATYSSFMAIPKWKE